MVAKLYLFRWRSFLLRCRLVRGAILSRYLARRAVHIEGSQLPLSRGLARGRRHAVSMKSNTM
jgi:hypothetical protein